MEVGRVGTSTHARNRTATDAVPGSVTIYTADSPTGGRLLEQSDFRGSLVDELCEEV